jgi:hypothetical protein
MATQPVFASLSGTTWTLDVTLAELVSDTSIKDFVVLFNSVLQSPALFTKLSATSIQYSGPSMNALVEVRRDTDVAPYQLVAYRSPILSADYNENLKKISRKLEELVKYPPGFANVPSISDQPYGATWASDTINAASRSALYAEVESVKTSYAAADASLLSNINTRAPLNSPALTGDPTAPTQSSSDNTTKIATTQFVNNALIPYAPKDNPTFTGTVTAPTPSISTNSGRVPTTSWVHLLRSPRRFLTWSFLDGLSMNEFIGPYIPEFATYSYFEFLFKTSSFLGQLHPSVSNPSYYLRVNNLFTNGAYAGVGTFLNRATLTQTVYDPNAAAPYNGNAAVLASAANGFTCIVKGRLVRQGSNNLWNIYLETQRHLGGVSLNDVFVHTTAVQLPAALTSIQIGALAGGQESNTSPIIPAGTSFELWAVS